MQERNTRNYNRERSGTNARSNRSTSNSSQRSGTRAANSNVGLSYKKNRSPASAQRANSRKAAQQKARKQNAAKAANYAANIGKNIAKKGKSKNPIVIAVGVLVIVIILLIIIFNNVGSGDSTPVSSSKDITSGVNYIKELEGKSVDAIESDIQQRKKIQRLEALKNGTMSVWAQFDDSVILGDSRAVGFYYYDFLPEDRVLAEAGNTILNIDDHLEELKKLNPSNVFICYGVNDIGGFYDSTEDYCNDMKTQMQKIWEQVPNCTIYISSIIQCVDPAFDTSSAWRRIPEYNEALKKMCDENNWPFIDNDAVVEEYKDHYQPDGIHLEPVFYEPWALNMISAVMDWEAKQSGDTSASSQSTTAASEENSDSSESTDTAEASDSTDETSDSGE